MAERTTVLAAPSRAAFDAVTHDLATRADVETLARARLEQQPVDTADRRLARAGMRMWRERDAGRGRLVLLTATGAELDCADACDLPAPVDALPPGRLSAAIATVAGVRLLVARAHSHRDVGRFALRDDAGKIVLRLTTESAIEGEGEGEGEGDAGRVLLRPLRGYGDTARRWREALVALGFVPVGGMDGDDGVASPTGSTPAGDALRVLLAPLLDAMAREERGILDDADPEHLHRFRVAVRRARSALREFGAALPPRAVAELRAELGWIARRSGPARDLDVHLEAFPAQVRLVPPALAPGLETLRARLARRHAEMRAPLLVALRSPRYAALVDMFDRLVRDPADRRGAAARLPFGPFAAGRIARVLRRMRREGRAIGADAPPEALHDLRKTAKRLRYAVEMVRPLYPAGALTPLLDPLRRLQDVLGAYQDMTVQADWLTQEAADMAAAEPGAAVPALLASGALLGEFHRAAALARAEFDERFAAFDSRSVRRAARELFPRHATVDGPEAIPDRPDTTTSGG